MESQAAQLQSVSKRFPFKDVDDDDADDADDDDDDDDDDDWFQSNPKASEKDFQHF